MLRTETQILSKFNPNFKRVDELCFLSKNLYNYVNYIIRQEFIETSKEVEQGIRKNAIWKRYNEIDKELISSKQIDYISLPNNTSQKVVQQLDLVWKSFFNSLKSYKKNKKSFTGKPSLPNYKHKTNGRNVVVFTSNQFKIKDNLICFPKKANLEPIKTGLDLTNKNLKINQIRLVPCKNKIFKIEIVYEKENVKIVNKESNNYLGIDIGINNLMTLTSNKAGFQPIIINGRPLKSINQFYNKEKARLQSELTLQYGEKRQTSNRLNNLTIKRNNKINDYIHKSTKYVKSVCLKNDISIVVIGLNKQWKTDVNIGCKTNQSFVSIPHSKMIEILKYKLEEIGITLIVREEAHTSKCSFMDNESVEHHDLYIGKRIKRGLFKTKEGILINSDVNGSFNILRKEITDISYENMKSGDRGLILNPITYNIGYK